MKSTLVFWHGTAFVWNECCVEWVLTTPIRTITNDFGWIGLMIAIFLFLFFPRTTLLSIFKIPILLKHICVTYIVSFSFFHNLVEAYVCCLIICNGLVWFGVHLTHFHERFQFICYDNCCVKDHTHKHVLCTVYTQRGSGVRGKKLREISQNRAITWHHIRVAAANVT